MLAGPVGYGFYALCLTWGVGTVLMLRSHLRPIAGRAFWPSSLFCAWWLSGLGGIVALVWWFENEKVRGTFPSPGSLQSFMHIWNYLDPRGGDVRDGIRQVTSEYEYDRNAGYAIAFEPYPRPGCLIPFCSTDDGNYLNWRTTGEPAEWCVVACDCGSARLIPAEGVNMVQCLAMLVRKVNPFGDAFCNVDSFEPPLQYSVYE